DWQAKGRSVERAESANHGGLTPTSSRSGSRTAPSSQPQLPETQSAAVPARGRSGEKQRGDSPMVTVPNPKPSDKTSDKKNNPRRAAALDYLDRGWSAI